MPNKNPHSLLRLILVGAWIAGLLLIAWTCLRLRHSIESADQTAQAAALQRASFTIREAVDGYVHGLQGIVGLYVTSGFKVSPSRMREYSASIQQFSTYKGAYGFGFVRRVPKEQERDYIREMRKDSPRFQIFDVLRGKLVRAEDRFVIEALQNALPRPLSAHGLDVGSEISRRTAAERSAKEGRAIITGPIQLLSNIETGFLMFLPIYGSGRIPPSEGERMSQLVGWAYVSIQMDQLMEALKPRLDDKLRLRILDENDPGSPRLLFESAEVAKSREPVSWFRNTVEIAGRRWVVQGTVAPESLWNWSHFFPFAVFLLLSGAYTIGLFIFLRVAESRFQSEEKVQEIQTWVSALVDGANYAIMSTRRDGILTTFNKEAERMLGYQASEVIASQSPLLFHDAGEIQRRAADLEKALKRPLGDSFEDFARALEAAPDIKEWTFVRKDGTKFPVRLSMTCIRDASGQVAGFLGVAEDITGERILRGTIESQRMQMIANSKMSSLGEMAAGIAHEINNPLAVIMGKSELLLMKLNQEKTPPSALKEELSKISATALRIATIVKGLRSFARNSDQDPMSEVEVRQIIDETLELCRERFRSEFVEISVDCEPGLRVMCRPAQISQVLMNLLNNSFDAVRDLKEKSVRIEARRIGGKIEISVTDSGDGIPDSIADRIMEPFFTTKETGSGTGLGLSIAAGVMRSHHGELWLDRGSPRTRFVMALKAL